MTSASDDLHEPGTAAPRESVLDVAAAAWKDLADLIQAELQLLRAELSEKLTLTAVSAGLIAAGTILLLATLVLLLQAAIGGLVALGLSWLTAVLVVAAFTLAAGAALVWFGIKNMTLRRLTPTKTIAQLQKDAQTLTRLE